MATSKEYHIPQDHRQQESSSTFSKEKVVRATRVMHRALMRNRVSLLEQLVKDKKGREELKKEQAQFFDQTEGSSVVELDAAIEKLVPPEFWENPTSWIEAQPSLLTRIEPESWRETPHFDETGVPTIDEMRKFWGNEYDQYKVRKFSLTQPGTGETIDVVSKRITPLIFSEAIKEIQRTREAQAAGIPTPKVYAEVVDRGNVYVWLEYIPNAQTLGNIAEKISDVLSPNIDSAEKLFSRCETKGYLETTFEQDWFAGQKERYRAAKEKCDEEQKIVHMGKHIKQEIRVWANDLAREGFFDRLVTINTEKPFRGRYVLSSEGLQVLREKFLVLEIDYGSQEGLMKKSEHDGLSVHSILWNTFVESVAGRGEFSNLREALSDFGGFLSQRIGFQVPPKEFISWRNRYDDSLYEIVVEVARFVSSKITGFSSHNEFVGSIESFLEAHGFEHPDLHGGNVLVQWDENTERLVRDENGKAKFFIIDWEPKYKKPGTS